MKTRERIERECRDDLKEIAHFYGGWDELRKLIYSLEDNDAEEAWMRSMENGTSQAERDEQHFNNQKLK
jgi:hypothetical protein